MGLDRERIRNEEDLEGDEAEEGEEDSEEKVIDEDEELGGAVVSFILLLLIGDLVYGTRPGILAVDIFDFPHCASPVSRIWRSRVTGGSGSDGVFFVLFSDPGNLGFCFSVKGG